MKFLKPSQLFQSLPIAKSQSAFDFFLVAVDLAVGLSRLLSYRYST